MLLLRRRKRKVKKNLYEILKVLKKNAKSTMMGGIFLMIGGFVFSGLQNLYQNVPIKLISYFAIGIGFLLPSFTWIAQIFIKEKFDIERAESIITHSIPQKPIESKETIVKTQTTEENPKDEIWEYLDNLQENLKEFGNKI